MLVDYIYAKAGEELHSFQFVDAYTKIMLQTVFITAQVVSDFSFLKY
jgi:hypothetical protein